MNTSTSPDARSLAHRLTTVGHALHHRLFTQMRESGIHPKTVLILSVIDGRIDAPWVRDRISRGGKRLAALAERGWITPDGDGWALTDDGRALLEKTDAAHSALLSDIPADELTRLTAALDAVSEALALNEGDSSPQNGLRGGSGFGRGFGPGFGLGFDGARGFRPGRRGFGSDADRHGHGYGHGHGCDAGAERDEHGDAAGQGRHGEAEHGKHGHRHGHGFEHGHRHGHRHGHGFKHGHRHGHGFEHGHRHGHGDEHGGRHDDRHDDGTRRPGRGGHGHGRGDRRGFGFGDHADRSRGFDTDHHRGPRAAQRAFERGFDAGFSRGREASASE